VTRQPQKIFDRVRSWAWTSSPMTEKTRVFSTVSEEDTAKNLSMQTVKRSPVPSAVFLATDAPDGVLAAVSERGTAPEGVESPTAYLARRFAAELGVPDLPLVRATQVHGRRAVTVDESPAKDETVDAGSCDALVTRLFGVGLVVQTADCVPVLLASSDSVGAVHAGWRGAAANVAGAAVESLLAITEDSGSVRTWLGPSIGPCCYEVGAEVARRFGHEFVRPSGGSKFLLDLPAVVRSQLVAAGIRPEAITQPNGCTMCGGARFASWRRDRENAGRMIALIARL
jgi:polyphenol oxidase